MRAKIGSFLKDRSGASAVEYGILLAVLSLTIVAGVGAAGDSLQNFWTRLANEFDSGVK